MLIPDCFYYSAADEKEVYDSQAPGELDVSLLAQSQPCWKKPFQSQLKPKRLIL